MGLKVNKRKSQSDISRTGLLALYSHPLSPFRSPFRSVYLRAYEAITFHHNFFKKHSNVARNNLHDILTHASRSFCKRCEAPVVEFVRHLLLLERPGRPRNLSIESLGNPCLTCICPCRILHLAHAQYCLTSWLPLPYQHLSNPTKLYFPAVPLADGCPSARRLVTLEMA